MPARQHTRHTRQSEAEHDRIVLEVAVIDEDRRRLHQHRDERNRRLPPVDALQARIPPHEDHDGWYVREVLRHEHGRAHEDLQVVRVELSGDVEREPARIDKISTV